MGYYIQTPRNQFKAEQMVDSFGAEILHGVDKPVWKDIPDSKALICVVDNGAFEAAALCYSEDELEAFLPTETDKRPRVWVVMDKDVAHSLAGYVRA